MGWCQLMLMTAINPGFFFIFWWLSFISSDVWRIGRVAVINCRFSALSTLQRLERQRSVKDFLCGILFSNYYPFSPTPPLGSLWYCCSVLTVCTYSLYRLLCPVLSASVYVLIKLPPQLSVLQTHYVFHSPTNQNGLQANVVDDVIVFLCVCVFMCLFRGTQAVHELML